MIHVDNFPVPTTGQQGFAVKDLVNSINKLSLGERTDLYYLFIAKCDDESVPTPIMDAITALFWLPAMDEDEC